MALIDGGERVATVTAATPMRMLVLGRHEFNEMLEIAMPAVTPKLLAVVGARMRTIDRHAGVEVDPRALADRRACDRGDSRLYAGGAHSPESPRRNRGPRTNRPASGT